MKAIIDAVNELKGDDLLDEFKASGIEACDCVILECISNYYDSSNRIGDICAGGVEFNSGFYRLICSYDLYISTVNELSHASWIKGASLVDYQAADKEVLKVENKTVEVDGMVYEIGKLYMFSDKNGDSEIGELSLANDINDGNGLMYQSKVSLRSGSKYEWWHSISAIKSDIGTITPAPVKLVDGAAYEFTARGKKLNGIYEKHHNTMNIMVGQYFNLETCSNITRLVPEVK